MAAAGGGLVLAITGGLAAACPVRAMFPVPKKIGFRVFFPKSEE